MGIFSSKAPDPVWDELAQRWGGKPSRSGLFGDEAVDIHVEPWSLRLTRRNNDEDAFTTLRTPYVGDPDFQCNVYRVGFFSDLAKLVGAQDVIVGDPHFDEAFMVKATDEDDVRALLTPELRLRLLAQPVLSLRIRPGDGAEGRPGAELYFQRREVIRELDLLEQLLELHLATLRQLVQLGLADASVPQPKL